MTAEHIVVLGNMPIKYDLNDLTEQHNVIVCGNAYKTFEFPYAVTNSESRLQDMLNSSNFHNTDILTTESLFKKYIFFDQVDCLPGFPGHSVVGKPEEASEQSLALMLACWMEIKNIYLFGYDIQNLQERSRLLMLSTLYPHNNIMYVRKPNPAKIFLFDSYENMSVIDYTDFEKIK